MRSAGLLAVALLSSGCWLQIGAGPGHTRHNPVEANLTAGNVDTLQQLWSVEMPGRLSEAIVSPEGRVFVTRVDTHQSAVRAVDAATGGTLWDTSLVSVPPVDNAFALGTPVTFVGGQLASGFLGFVPFAPGPMPGPACALGSVVLNPATGAKSAGASAFPSAAVEAAPVMARSLITVPTTQPCSLSDLDVTLEVTGSPGGGWTTPITGLLVGSFMPTLTQDRVLLTHGASVDSYAIDGCTADCLRWTRTFAPEPLDPVVEGTGPVFVRTIGATLHALDQADGATQWTAGLGGSTGGGVAVADGTVYVTSLASSGAGGVIEAFDAAGCGASSCAPVWEGTFDGTSVGAPVVGGGVVYVPDGNSVVAFDAAGCGAATCSPLADVAATGSGSLSLSGGRLFLAGNGRLTALAPEP